MQHTGHSRWKLIHLLSILVHLGLICAGSVAFVYNLGQNARPLGGTSLRISSADTNPCPLTLVDNTGSWGAFDVADRTLLTNCIFVGAFGLTINVAAFGLLLSMETHRVTLTEGQQHWRKQIITAFACVLNIFLAGAGVAMAGILSARIVESKSLIMPLVWVSLQAPIALSTAILDAIKNYREGQDLLD
ncbi:hypothetical protein QBC40DRAFT_186268 [Triangularia verruculosa]|uniref:Uncharacterized protein n=1 Tax=Triangularia verruculosa TaxID=2587418 RepID=A0AAN6X7F5_9PEZI|nr:hypothetical protein QBC40DRAFT_186268 [Triangularia verruculosa]